jgi:Ctr copper transporter family
MTVWQPPKKNILCNITSDTPVTLVTSGKPRNFDHKCKMATTRCCKRPYTDVYACLPSSRLTIFSMHLLAGQAIILLTSLIAGALAHDNGMDMNMDQGMPMNMGNMIMYLHFTIGDNLWFLGWAPRTAGAMAGACIGIFMLATAERWLVAMRGVMEEHWSMRFVLFPIFYSRFSPLQCFAQALVYTALRSRSPISSKIPPPWRRRRLRRSAPIHRCRMLHSLGLAGCGITLRPLHSFSLMTSPVVFCKLSSPASTFFSCSLLCEFSHRV